MLTDPSDLPAAHRARASTAELQHMLGQCNELLQRELPQLMDRALLRVDDTLYEFADKAESDRTYFAHFEAQRRLRRERANLKRRFLRNLSDTLALFQDASRTLDMRGDHLFESEDLEILGDKDLEQSLVLSNMVSKAESRYLAQLSSLTRHFADLLGRPNLRQRDMPISPTAITNAFAAALGSIEDLELSTILVVHKIFDQQVMDHLESYYDACVNLAVAQGLKPLSRKHQIVKNANVPGRESSQGARRQSSGTSSPAASRPLHEPASYALPQAEVSGGGAGVGVHARSEVAIGGSLRLGGDAPTDQGLASGMAEGMEGGVACTFETLQQVLAGARQIHPGHSKGRVPGRTLATSDLIALLSSVEPEVGVEVMQGAVTPSRLRDAVGSQLRTSMDPSMPRQLERNDEDAMDLVFLLFEQLLVSADIPDAIKVLVSRLQIPYVKIALLDRQFFDNTNHPARRLLNGIAQASIGWNDSDRERDDGLYALLQDIVERILGQAEIDPQMFTALEQELAAHVTQQREMAAAVERRVVHEAETRNARTDALRAARSLIEAQVAQHGAVPPVVNMILEQGWLEAMTEAYAQSGNQGRAWRDGERILQDLIWSVAPKRNAEERRELLRRIPELLRDLREHLSLAVGDQQQLARWLKELRTIHIKALRGEGLAGTAAQAGSARVEHGDLADDDLSLFATDVLPVGCWLEILSDESAAQRFKLAWRGVSGRGPLLFVDRGGRKAFELAMPELDALLEQGLATVIGTGNEPLVDRAMEAVRHSLSIH